MAWQWFHRLGSPRWFYSKTKVLTWVLGILSVSLLVWGLIWGFLYAPKHADQGDVYRIIYLHVPAAIISMVGYYVMAVAAAIGYIWNMKLSFWVMKCAAVIGLMMTALALATGILWGKPTWGTWWFWDARLVTVLILLLLYAGILALQSAYGNGSQLANKACAILALVGTVNIPIIYKSVDWWFTLHQPASLGFKGNFTGVEEIRYTIEDDQGAKASASLAIQVASNEVRELEPPKSDPDTESNKAPTAKNDGPLYTQQGLALTGIDVLSNDHDPEGGKLKIVSVSSSDGGVVTIHDDGTLTYQSWVYSVYSAILKPLAVMIVAFYILYSWLLLLWVRAEILYQERRTQWVSQMLTGS